MGDTNTTSPWSGLPLDFLSQGEWAYGQGADAPDRRLFRVLLRRWEQRQDRAGLNARLLEVGFGSAIDLRALREQGALERLEYVGLDLTPEFVEAARAEFPEQRFERADVMALTGWSADFIWCRHVLEHVSDPYVALRNLWAATRDVLLVSWFIRPTWDEAEVRCQIADGFLHWTCSARALVELKRELGAHLYRFDFDHAGTRASVWLFCTEKCPDLCEEAHRFLQSSEFLRSIRSAPQRPERRVEDLFDVLAEAESALERIAHEARPREGLAEGELSIGEDTVADARAAHARAFALRRSQLPLDRYERLVLWGFTDSLDSMRHIMTGFARAAERLGKETVRLPDAQESRRELRRGDLVFAVDVEGSQLYAVQGVDYVLHNFHADHRIWDLLEEDQFLRLQVYTLACERYGVAWEPVRRYDRETRTLFQPWGTDLDRDEFMEPIFNPDSDVAAFVGAIWDDGGIGNRALIDELVPLLRDRGLRFEHRTQVPWQEMVAFVRAARLAPAFAGRWQVENGYLPCRSFKHPSYGVMTLTNVPKMRALLSFCHVGGETLSGMLDEALSLSECEQREIVLAQQQVVARYTYRTALEAISRALEEGR